MVDHAEASALESLHLESIKIVRSVKENAELPARTLFKERLTLCFIPAS